MNGNNSSSSSSNGFGTSSNIKNNGVSNSITSPTISSPTTSSTSTTTSTSTTSTQPTLNVVDNGVLAPPTVETISQALVALYQSNDATVRDMANKWLMHIQTLPEAWEFCPKLIFGTNVMELQFFGASTLEQKLRKEWISLQTDVRIRIFNVMVNLTEHTIKLTNSVVSTRVCVALSIMAMYTYSSLWKRPLDDVMHLCSPNLDQPLVDMRMDRLRFVLDFLTIFPEELITCAISYSTKIVKREITTDIDVVYQYLLACLTIPPQVQGRPEQKQILRALSAWLHYMLPIKTEILRTIFESTLATVDKDPSQIELMCTLIERSLVHLSARLSPEVEQMFVLVAENLLALMPPNFARAMQEGRFETAKAICHLFVQVLYHNSSKLLKADLVKRYLETLLHFVQQGNHEMCELMQPLFQELKGRTEYTHESLGKEYLDNYFLSMLHRLLTLAVYCTDDPSQTTTFRKTVKDMLLNIQRALFDKSNFFINHLVAQLQSDLQNNVQEWQKYEVTLAFISMLTEPSNKDSKYMAVLLQLIPTLPVKTLPLIKTSIVLIGKMSGYLQGDVAALEKVVADLIPAFSSPDLLEVAANSFYCLTVTRQCAQHLMTNITAILNLCAPHLKSNQTHPSIVRVYEALLYIIRVVPSSQLAEPFQKLLIPVIENVTQIIQAGATSKSLQLLKIQLKVYEKTINLVDLDDKSIPKEHPLYHLYRVIVPQMETVLNVFGSDSDVLEEISKMYRWTLMYCKPLIEDFVVSIIKQATTAFTRNPSHHLLQVLFTVNGNMTSPEVDDTIRQALSMISTTTFQVLRSETVQNVNLPLSASHPLKKYPTDPQYLLSFSVRSDLSKEYFTMLIHMLKSYPQCVDVNIVATVFTYVLHNILDVNDVSTNRNCFILMESILMLKKSSNEIVRQRFEETVNQVIATQGGVLLRNLLVGVAFLFNYPMINFAADVFQAYGTVFPTPFRQELRKFLINTDFLSGIVDSADKQVFLTQLQRVNESKEEYRFANQTFAMLCKGPKWSS
ncbi:hypothetical protein SAMD00019534_037030 [Acytostelium subglobosum LB1]|uniref:hypothetical protein n=1 Tax=Acytostelium subglobosum LB1 TaxID=1410327 RepID=UPI000644C67A|nr:hypothetical protein SAMD00019534_037030 [Acytostelium subglobosum LB1]GAM20528.1 hypothetical protein SAMD00019534_037030 [Acytostelium subglobosum LB1]|eukprot:XP_012760049.1 hypothetical protein SAMD00019534_037030 [Acytostelium subglobosum LB1]